MVQEALGLQVLKHLLSCLKPVHSLIGAGFFCELGVYIKYVYKGQVVPPCYFKVIEIVGRGDLYGAGSEFRVHVFICNHRYPSVHQGQNEVFAYKGLVALVVGIYCHCSISQHGFRPRGCNHHVFRP